FTDGEWVSFSLPLAAANRQARVNIRFNLGPTTLTDHLSGWNIENFAITGNYVGYDVGPVELVAPESGCGHSSAETVSIMVENFGPGPTPDEIPVRYSIDGGENFTEEIISGSIAFEGQRLYHFTGMADFSTPGTYHVIIETTLGVDEELSNNSLDTILHVDPAYTLPYDQDFESGDGYWRVEGGNATFEYGTPMGSIIHTAASGVKAWVTDLDGDYNDNEDSYLVGPCFDFTGIDYPVFECKLFYHAESQQDGANLEYSLNNGQTWSRLGDLGDGDIYGWNWYNSDAISALAGEHGWTGGPDDWRTARILLDTTIFRNNPSVKFRFHFASDEAGRLEGIGIDDVRIYDAPRDVGVLAIDYPVDGCAQDIGNHVAVTIMNYSLDTLMAGDTIIVGYDFEAEPTVVDTFMLAGNLVRNATVPYTFTKKLEVTTSGMKDIKAFTLLPDDIDFYNDTLTNDTTDKTIEVALTPYVFLPPEIYTVRPDTIILDAYTGVPGDTYLWQDSSTDSVFHVTAIADGIYHVTASNGFCEYRDTTFVYRLIPDVGVTGILDPVSDCELGDAVRPRIEVMNYGTDTLHVGDTVPVRYRIDAEPVIEETAVLAGQILPDSTFEYTFTTASDMAEIRTYNMTSFTELAYDDTLANDTLQTVVEIYGYTPIDLGPDTVVRGLQYTIDAGPGYDTYMWQDSSTNQNLVVDTTGQYRVTVKAGTQCENSDSMLVTLLIPDIGIERLFNPTDACGLSATEHVEFHVLNTGTDTLNTNDTIFIAYQLDGGTRTYDTLYIDRVVEPGDSILFSSAGTVDVSTPGAYQFSVDVSYAKDLIPGNDSLDQTIEVYSNPAVSLGADTVVNTKTHTLDAGSGYVSYLWQDGSAGQQFVVEYEKQTPDSSYTVTVTDANGCQASDEVKIGFDLWDIGIASIMSPVSACLLTDQEELRVLVKNFGTHPIVGERVRIEASLDGGIPITVQKTITQVLYPGDSIEFLFGVTFDFSGEGDHGLTAHSIYGQDDDPHNDTMDVIITHFGIPQPELGGVNDSLGTSLPVMLDVGADFISYLWNGVPGYRTYNATEYGWYIVEVTDLEGCVGKDSIFLLQSTGIADFLLPGELKVFPVPSNQFLNIEYRYTEAEDLYLDIYNSNGRKILNKQYSNADEIRETIDVTAMAKGIYFLRLRSDERQLIRQIAIY
ncbi:MAG: hypothetical protein AMS26_15765, partial [Bacteroides sp. SM23_62]